jgi:hypothetical protein
MRPPETLLEGVHRDWAVGFERQQSSGNAVHGSSRLYALKNAVNVHGLQL